MRKGERKSKVYVRLIEFKSGKRVVIEERFGAIGRLDGQNDWTHSRRQTDRSWEVD